MAGEPDSTTPNPNQRSFHVISVITEFMKKRLSSKGFEWNPPSGGFTPTDEDVRLIESLTLLADDLVSKFGEAINDMIGRATAREIVDYESFVSVADELLAEGIQWSHVVTLLVFSSELAHSLGVQEGQEDMIINITEWLARYLTTTSSLNTWVTSQGGWSGLISYERTSRPILVAPAGYKASFAVLASNQIIYFTGYLVSVTLAALTFFRMI